MLFFSGKVWPNVYRSRMGAGFRRRGVPESPCNSAKCVREWDRSRLSRLVGGASWQGVAKCVEEYDRSRLLRTEAAGGGEEDREVSFRKLEPTNRVVGKNAPKLLHKWTKRLTILMQFLCIF